MDAPQHNDTLPFTGEGKSGQDRVKQAGEKGKRAHHEIAPQSVGLECGGQSTDADCKSDFDML
jgi:hypothetical protein